MSEERLWAPWRMPYTKGSKSEECVFCAEPGRGDDEGNARVLPELLRDSYGALRDAWPDDQGSRSSGT